MIRGKTNAKICRLNGWAAGDVLEGVQSGTLTRIILTAVGEEGVLARTISSVTYGPFRDPRVADRVAITSDPRSWSERSWSLSCREWERVS